ncbi:hypothetical protein CTI12_AA477590 [Artemisia annua]|uniref:Lipase-like C-terminal domain-containing protein n=1 Tax=Artemisia annua TaxID=35608 RepID=A0A2U1LLM7_ARTAN|nr:hypothetical protein CTI12_AA477590 [Artemisia annua]
MMGHLKCFLMATTWLLLQVFQVTSILVNVVIEMLSGVYMFIRYDVFSSPLEEKSIMCKDEPEPVTCDSDVAPIVLVHGVFGFGEGKMGGVPYFGGIENTHRRVFCPDLGSLTSLYDRARQLFYYLKGGQVDYGEDHSKTYGHSQFGCVYEQGKYSEWKEDNPIHFVGHSAGAQVIRMLQQMLADKAFKGYQNTNAKWIASITTIAGALNGSTITYIYGMKPDDWRFAKTFSPLWLLSVAVTIYEWLDVPWLKRYYSFGFDHFHMSRKHIGFWGLVDCLSGNAGPFASSDWVIPEVTIQGSTHINSQLNTFSDTYYFSYAVKATEQVEGKVVPKRIQSGGSWFRVQASWICDWSYPKKFQPPYSEYRDEDWWDNDSQLNTISMTHPRLPSEHPLSFDVNDSRMDPQSGVWYCQMLEAYHAQFVLSIRTGTPIHQLYDTIFNRCRSLDMKRRSQSVK